MFRLTLRHRKSNYYQGFPHLGYSKHSVEASVTCSSTSSLAPAPCMKSIYQHASRILPAQSSTHTSSSYFTHINSELFNHFRTAYHSPETTILRHLHSQYIIFPPVKMLTIIYIYRCAHTITVNDPQQYPHEARFYYAYDFEAITCGCRYDCRSVRDREAKPASARPTIVPCPIPIMDLRSVNPRVVSFPSSSFEATSRLRE
ncbi:hypothetical protein DFH27DRAFT_65998 [Peziza echinospora]|nr:hypothetical protein DFH27DRAFT_65998 [Peziza echinospora]